MSKRIKKGRIKKSKRDPNKIAEIEGKLNQLFAVNDGQSHGYRELIRKFGLKEEKTKYYLKDQLFSMERTDRIRRLSDGKYASTAEAKHITGVLDHVNPNFGYIIISEWEDDIWVKTSDMKYAVHGDTVNVRITRPSGKGFRPEGKVISIVKRAREEYVGRIDISVKYAFVIPDIRNIHFDIFVHSEKIGEAKSNDKVLVKIKDWHNAKNKSPLGEVAEVLGQTGDNEAEIHSIMAEYGLPFRFPAKIEKAADKIPDSITMEEIRGRQDFRKITTFTVDPHDAKDFDDALSIRQLDKDTYEIGVHIADVSHYLTSDGLLDKEAIDRATSVYLVDRVVPMLPERLSNGLCSLGPGEEKLTFSVVFEMNKAGKISRRWFGRTVIKSDRRFTYEEAQERIEGLDSDFAKELKTLNDLALILRKKRFKQGAVNFDTVEVKFRLDEKGRPLEVIPKERKDSHKMIEEFMLLANREVAMYIFEQKEKGKEKGSKTFVYRIHDDPDPEKLSAFASFASKFGHKLEMDKQVSSGLNKLMEKIEGKPEQNVLESLAIRSMAKARYTTETKKHFGLAFDHYTHFTSPIRRYPDVLVHRLLQHYLNSGKPEDKEELESLCIHSSEREKRAAEAERASIKYKQVEFMQSMSDQTFDGIVSGVTEWGIFVEIVETKCEGMIRITDLDDDFYEFDEKNYRVVGKNNKQMITLGDKLKVQVKKTDIDRRTIDLIMIGE